MKIDYRDEKEIESDEELQSIFLEDIKLSDFEKEKEKLPEREKFGTIRGYGIVLHAKNNKVLTLEYPEYPAYKKTLIFKVVNNGKLKEGHGFFYYSQELFLCEREELEDIMESLVRILREGKNKKSGTGYYFNVDDILKELIEKKDYWKLEEIEKLGKLLLDKVDEKIEERRQREKGIEKESKEEEIKERSIWEKQSYIRYYPSQYSDDLFIIDKEELTYQNLKVKLNRNFNEIFDFYDVSRSFNLTSAEDIVIEFFENYPFSKDLKVKITDGSLKWKFTFKKNNNGIFFYDSRIRKNKFKRVINYMDKHRDKSRSEIKKMIKYINKFSGIKRDVLEFEELNIIREFEDEPVKTSMGVDYEGKDKWLIEIQNKKYPTNWKILKEYFTSGMSAHNIISDDKFLELLRKIGEEEPLKVLKDIILVGKL